MQVRGEQILIGENIQRSRNWIAAQSGNLLILVVAVIAATCSDHTTAYLYNIAAIVIGVAIIALVLLSLQSRRLAAPTPLPIAAAAVASLFPQLVHPPSQNVRVNHALFFLAGSLSVAATVAVIGFVALRGKQLWPVLAGGIMMVGAAILTVPAGQAPRIDVWVIFQRAAAIWLHRGNPYAVTYQGVPGGQTANCFNYLPMSFVASWPGWLTFGDVRYAEVAVMVLGWLALTYAIWRQPAGGAARQVGRVVGAGSGQARRSALVLVLAAITTAGTIRVSQQAWNESLALGFMLIAVALLMRQKNLLACLPLALALATKQHIALFVPLMIALPAIGLRRTVYSIAGSLALASPWLIWNFPRFKECTVNFFLDAPARRQSISIWRAIPAGFGSPLVIVLVLGASYLAITRLPRTPGGFLLGCGVVLLAFNLVNKQSFENQWWFAAQLVMCGLALVALEHPAQAQAEDEQDEGREVTGRAV